MFTVKMEHTICGLVRKQGGLTWNEAQSVASDWRKLPEKPQYYLVTILPEAK